MKNGKEIKKSKRQRIQHSRQRTIYPA